MGNCRNIEFLWYHLSLSYASLEPVSIVINILKLWAKQAIQLKLKFFSEVNRKWWKIHEVNDSKVFTDDIYPESHSTIVIVSVFGGSFIFSYSLYYVQQTRMKEEDVWSFQEFAYCFWNALGNRCLFSSSSEEKHLF